MTSKDSGRLLIEAKASHTAKPDMVIPMRRLSDAWKKHFGPKREVSCTLVHRPARAASPSRAIAEGMQVVSFKQLGEMVEKL